MLYLMIKQFDNDFNWNQDDFNKMSGFFVMPLSDVFYQLK